MSAYCPTILESPCQESRLMSHRNKHEQVAPLPVRLMQIIDHTMESDCTSIDKVDDQSRSISLVQQLKSSLSNKKQYNLPRQIKSLFSCESINEEIKVSKKTHRNLDEECEKLTKKEYDDIMAGKTIAKYDLPRSRNPPPDVVSQKTLKQSIYQRLMQAKRDKEKLFVEVKKNKQNVKEATFRPKDNSRDSKIQTQAQIKQTTLNKIKDIIKSKIAYNVVEPESIRKGPVKPYGQFYINIGQDSQQMSPPRTKPNAYTKYQNILKENVSSINNILTSTNKRPKAPPPIQTCENKAKYQSFLRSLKLRQSLMKPPVNSQNSTKQLNCISNLQPETDTLNRHRSMTSLTFEERQKKLISSKQEKIVKHSIQKQKDQLRGCTFKPHLTPYRSNPTQEMQRWSSYAELNKRKMQMKY